MMRIAIICKTFLKGGAEKQALTLARLLTEKGIYICLVNWYGNKVDPGNLDAIKYKTYRYFPLRGTPFLKLYRFQKILKKEKITILVSYLTLSNFVSGVSKLFNKNITSIGGIRNEKLPYYKYFFEKLIHNYLNDATVFNNYSAKDKFVKKGFKAEKISVIQNAIDFNNSDVLTRSSNGEIKIITVGRFVKQKDYATALNAFRNLVEKNRNKNYTYYIVGYGPLEKEVRSLAKNLKIEKWVKIFINPPDVVKILKESDIFLSTSLFEGVSNSIMEAMVQGLPVVATNVGDNNYLIKDGYNGFLVPCKDVNSIVERLEYLSESEEARNEFGKNSLNVIESSFSGTKLLENYLSLFSKFQ